MQKVQEKFFQNLEKEMNIIKFEFIVGCPQTFVTPENNLSKSK